MLNDYLCSRFQIQKKKYGETTRNGLTNQKNDSGKSKTNGTQVKSVKKQPGTVWDRIKTGDNNKPVGYFIAVLISLAAIIMIISARFQRKK